MLELRTQDKQREFQNDGRNRSEHQTLFFIFHFCSLVLLLIGAAGLVYNVVRWVRTGEGSFAQFGIIGSAMLMGFSVIVFINSRLLKFLFNSDRLRDLYANTISQDIQTSVAPTEHLKKDVEMLRGQIEQSVLLMREIAENTLLDDAARKKKYELHAYEESKQTFAQVDRLAAAREWSQIRLLMERLIYKYPNNLEPKRHFEQLEEMRKRLFPDELAQSRKTINDLIAISAWDKAVQHARTLLSNHPDMPQARELEAQVLSDRKKFRDEHLKRMAGDIQKLIARKRWNDSLGIARQLIEKYPDSVEAEALRLQMNTMEDNAEIEKRQELEEQIKDLVKRRNFIQAVEMAKYVIATYPSSPQAAVLRNQISKLEELAQEQEKEIQL
ncbi:MAG: outer membrane protein assembly factor BamD [Phycisphaerae bacterium]|nr:outer membrane protein assembly factor BamD [Phycisphaerae bacterium]